MTSDKGHQRTVKGIQLLPEMHANGYNMQGIHSTPLSTIYLQYASYDAIGKTCAGCRGCSTYKLYKMLDPKYKYVAQWGRGVSCLAIYMEVSVGLSIYDIINFFLTLGKSSGPLVLQYAYENGKRIRIICGPYQLLLNLDYLRYDKCIFYM